MDSLKKFVVRMLTADDELLSWAEVYAEPKPQVRGSACPWWPIQPTRFAIEKGGTAAKISVHWCDLDLARVQNLLEQTEVAIGQVFTMNWIEPIWLVAGMQNVPLPCVTVRQSIRIGVPVGDLATAGTA